MKPLIIFGSALAAVFAGGFLFILLIGGFGPEDVRSFLRNQSDLKPMWAFVTFAVILCADLFMAVPTLTVCILGGHFLGGILGGLSASTGMLAAGSLGYGISRRYGTRMLARLCKDPVKLRETQELFANRGPLMLLLCRAVPILPEVSCCMAGATGMPLNRFLIYYGLATVPYAFIGAYAGAHSSFDNPTPAIVAAVGLSLILWLAWFGVRRNARHRLSRRPEA